MRSMGEIAFIASNGDGLILGHRVRSPYIAMKNSRVNGRAASDD